ncbi:putative nucleoprotein [Hubei myriapoda virus 5]|uniref:Putative nucleoprotein n=1 Tax=Hubei myriapoda virus 5 TaxID=1922934 RepID=A0A1L3KPF6_9VIRU|nr:putative nucleoprotein [Hubei myriapoda virus 5]APG79249.1 putative nucleoprotein [Hubei myriapoda virus 5]APG79331.1 putative nucleoprotein [Hubei myriapoda virus 5]
MNDQAARANELHELMVQRVMNAEPQYWGGTRDTSKANCKKIWNVPKEMWDAYHTSITEWNQLMPFEQKIRWATNQMENEKSIRTAAGFEETMLVRHRDAEIDPTGMTAGQIESLIFLYNILRDKINRQEGQVGNAADMAEKTRRALYTFRMTGTISDKYLEEGQRGSVLARVKAMRTARHAGITAHVNEELNKFINEDARLPAMRCPQGVDATAFNTRLADIRRSFNSALPEGNAGVNASNKFMVDYITMPMSYAINSEAFAHDDAGFEKYWALLFRISIWSQGPNVGLNEWTRFKQAQDANCQRFLDLAVRGDGGLRVNPGLLTRQRLLGAAVMNNKTCTDRGFINVNSREQEHEYATFVSLVAVVDVERQAGLIVRDPGRTSDSEYILHQLLTLGLDTGMWYNKKEIPDSAIRVRFLPRNQ